MSVAFVDVTTSRRLQHDLEQVNQALEPAYEELQSTNEELHSTNEELSAINDELRLRSTELNRVNMFMECILASLRGGVVVLDANQHVLVWNEKAADLWGLRDDEAFARHFLGLDIGLTVDELRHAVKSCLSGETKPVEHVLHATNRRGRPIRCRVTCSP